MTGLVSVIHAVAPRRASKGRADSVHRRALPCLDLIALDAGVDDRDKPGHDGAVRARKQPL